MTWPMSFWADANQLAHLDHLSLSLLLWWSLTMVVSTAGAAALADGMAADPSRFDGNDFGDEDDYGLFDLEEDGPVTATSSANPSTNNSPSSSRVADASTTPAVDMQVLARRYNRTDSSSNILLMKRVGSTFFSVAGSVASDLDMLDLSSHHHHHYAAPAAAGADNNQRFVSAAQSFETSSAPPPAAVEVSCSMSDVLYHDIMLNIFAHMTATELAAFSETARRPNIDVHNYLRLQLERALLLDPIAGSSSNANNSNGGDDVQSNAHASVSAGPGRRSSFLTTSVELGQQASADGSNTSPITRRVSFHRQVSSSTCPIAVCGAGILSRLAILDRAKAEQLVEEYRTIADTTTTSTAYNKGSHSLFGTSPALRADAAMRELQDRMAHHKGAASCAVVFTVMGAAANKLMADGGLHMPAEAQQAATAFTLGCAGLGLVATRYGRLENDGDDATASDGASANAQDGAAANMARRVQALLMRMPRPEEGGVFPMAIIERMSPPQSSPQSSNPSPSNNRRGKRTKRKDSLNAVDQYQDSKVDSDYEAEHDGEDEDEDDYKSVVSSMEGLDISINAAAFSPVRRRPTGCLGAYARILRRAADAVTEHVRSQRKEAFDRLSDEEKAQTTTAFIDACSSDDNLEIVEDLVRNVGVDVDGFYVGSDGTTETCGLHTAAFNDATEIMKFLCSGIDERDPAKDCGLCDIDIVDSNKWSALHFAAGADSADGVRVLASFGAKMTEEAANGYTPYHWAERLSNSEAADELKRLGADDRFVFSNQMPFLTSRFFALMPSRFFAMMPVATN